MCFVVYTAKYPSYKACVIRLSDYDSCNEIVNMHFQPPTILIPYTLNENWGLEVSTLGVFDSYVQDEA